MVSNCIILWRTEKSDFIGRIVYCTQLSLCGQNYAVWNHPPLIALSAFSTGPKNLCLKKQFCQSMSWSQDFFGIPSTATKKGYTFLWFWKLFFVKWPKVALKKPISSKNPTRRLTFYAIESRDNFWVNFGIQKHPNSSTLTYGFSNVL